MASKFRIENSTDDDDADAGVDDYKVQSIANKYLSMAEVNKESSIGLNNNIEGVSVSGTEDDDIDGGSDDDLSDSLESQSSLELADKENVQDHINHPQLQQQVATESSQSIDVAKRDRKMQKLLKKLPKFFLSADTVDSDSDLDNAPVPDPRDNLHLSMEDSDESSLSDSEADGEKEARNGKAVKKRGKSLLRKKSKKSNNDDSDSDSDVDSDGNNHKGSRKQQRKLSKKKLEELRLQTARLNRAALLTLEPANERITLQDMIKIVRGGGQCEDTMQDKATSFGNVNQENYADVEYDEEVEYSIQVPQSNAEESKQAQRNQDQSVKKQKFDVKSLISKFSASTSVEVVADFKKIKSKSLLDGIILSSKRRYGQYSEAAAHRSNQKSLSFKEKMEEARLKISMQNRSNSEVKTVNQDSSTAVVQVDGDNNEQAPESSVLDQVDEEQQDDEESGDHDNSDKLEDSSFDYDIKSSQQNSYDPSPTLDILSDEYVSDEDNIVAEPDENPVSPANTSTNDDSAVDEDSIENKSYNQDFNLLTQGEGLQTQAPMNKNNNGGIKGMLARMNVNVKSIAQGVGDNGNATLLDAQTQSSDSEVDQLLRDPDDAPQRKKKRKIVDTDDDDNDNDDQDDQDASSEDENSQNNDSHLDKAKVNSEAKVKERTEFIDEEADLEDDEFMNMGGVDGDLLDREKALAEELAGFVTNDADLLQEYADDELIDQDDRVRELHGLLERRQDLAQVKNAVKITAGQLRGKTKTAAANQQNEEVNKFGRLEDDEDECDLGLNELDQVEDYGQFGSVIEKIMARNVEQKKKRMLNKRRRLQDETAGGQQSLGSNSNDVINGGSTNNVEDDEDWTNEHGADSGFVNLGIAGGELIITDLDHLEEFAKKRSILEQLDANDTGFKSSDVLSKIIIDGSNSQDSLSNDQVVSSAIFKSQSTNVKSSATQYKRLFRVDDNENSMGLANSGVSTKQDVSLNRLKSVVQLTEDELHQIRSGKSTSNSNVGGNNKSRMTSSEYSRHPSKHGPPRKTVGFKVGLQPSEKQTSSDSHDHKGKSSTLRSALKAAGMFEK
ncbi:hypothetical protein MP228_004159 [Amoeboaphelidium protococcarum]|nr:hypothetical protein MP228_004159 [Amoeboaphelidium protococcarum]